MPHEEVTIPYESVDLNGHADGGLWNQRNGYSTTYVTYDLKDENGRDILEPRYEWDSLHRCEHCDTSLRPTPVGDNKFKIEAPCAMSEGATPTFTLVVPSGRLAVADSLWDETSQEPPEKKGMASYNSALGRAQYYKEAEAMGVAYGYVGNSSPNLYLDSNTGNLYVASVDLDSKDEDVVPEGWTEIASITTDLWAYSIMDYSHYVSLGGDPRKVATPKVPAGTYGFTHYADAADFNEYGEGTIIFAMAEPAK